MRPRARIGVWAIVIPVAVLLVAYIVFALVTYRPPPSPPPPPPTATARPAATAAGGSSQGVAGAWTGTLTQQGGPFATYTFSMNLTESASGTVSGTARADVANRPQYYVVESVTGQVSGRTFTFQKGNVQQSNPPGQAWCIDAGQLTLSSDGSTMTGTWTDEGCGSGTITLTRASANAPAPRFVARFAASPA